MSRKSLLIFYTHIAARGDEHHGRVVYRKSKYVADPERPLRVFNVEYRVVA